MATWRWATIEMVCLITTTNDDENEDESQKLMEWENKRCTLQIAHWINLWWNVMWWATSVWISECVMHDEKWWDWPLNFNSTDNELGEMKTVLEMSLTMDDKGNKFACVIWSWSKWNDSWITDKFGWKWWTWIHGKKMLKMKWRKRKMTSEEKRIGFEFSNKGKFTLNNGLMMWGNSQRRIWHNWVTDGSLQIILVTDGFGGSLEQWDLSHNLQRVSQLQRVVF